MRKNVIYLIIAAVVGLFVGYLLFGTNPNEQPTGHSHETSEGMWTCSMHPQIMKTEPGDCPICGMDLIPASNTKDSLDVNQFKMTENAMALANIQTSVIGNSSIENEVISLSGKIEPNEDQTYTQSAHFNGRIEKLYVKTLGEKVHKGQSLAVVYSPELVSAQQELITASKIKESQPRLFEAVKNKFKNWMIPEKEINEIVNTGTVKTRLTIYSHISGVVTSLNMSEGGHIMDGMAIFQTANLNSVWAVFDAYEKQVSVLNEGQNITIRSNAYPNDSIQTTISYIDPILDAQTRTVNVRAVLQNKGNELKPGMFVEGSVTLNNRRKTAEVSLTIPKSAVLWTGKRSVVYVKTGQSPPTFQMREIVLGNHSGEFYTVLNGLQPGEEVVTQGTFTVDAAAQLQGKNSMMNR
ncbi:efflux RND transporter periplasmic adaptor subunit [Galbibacter sp. BG1]|uniref:efflux RND transporter periplasmic adaptor subunit n=1 Tax=Galbibacter sp. BG1 TaxID=1170699 RepID=UPI0015BBD6D0|nr:efflux RND transporter periplasmic adaptor subunit [Galbibacter sp. BG1]QLE02809.1 efflux RND transporter periplasmic adaptor subunit [Galbibacter sp. BG1]